MFKTDKRLPTLISVTALKNIPLATAMATNKFKKYNKRSYKELIER